MAGSPLFCSGPFACMTCETRPILRWRQPLLTCRKPDAVVRSNGWASGLEHGTLRHYGRHLGTQMASQGLRFSVFAEFYFWLLVVCSLVLPVAIYVALLFKRMVSRATILVLGVTLVVISGVDLFLLQRLQAMSKLTPSLLDDAVFNSEVTIGFYLLPVLFAGIGINVISHVLIRHLDSAQKTFRREHPES